MTVTRNILRRPILDDIADNRSLHRSFGISASGLVLQGLLRVGYTLTAARVLGPASYADFAFALAAASIAAIVWPASAGAAFSKFVSRAQTGDAGANICGSARHLLRRQGEFLLVMSVMGAGVAYLLFKSPTMVVGFLLLCLGVCGQGFGRGVHMALGMVEREAIAQSVAGAIALILLWSLLNVGVSVSAGLAAGILGAAFIGYSFAAWPRGQIRGRADLDTRREIDGFVIIAVFGSIASAGLVHLSIAYASWSLQPAAAGLYAAAVSLALPLSLVASAITMVLYPRMSRLTTRASVLSLRVLHLQAMLVLGFCGSLGMAAVLPLASLVVDITLGVEYAGVAELASILVLGVVLVGVASPSVTVMSTRRNGSLALVSGGAWIGLAAAVVTWLSMSDRAASVATGFVVGVWVTATIAVIASDRKLHGSSIVAWTAWSAGLTLLCFAGSSAPWMPMWQTVVVLAGAGTLCVGATVWCLITLRSAKQIRDSFAHA